MASKKQSDNNAQDQLSETGPPTAKRRRIGLACNACRVRKSRYALLILIYPTSCTITLDAGLSE